MRRQKTQFGTACNLYSNASELDELFAKAETKLRADARTKTMIADALNKLHALISQDKNASGCFQKLVYAGCETQDLLWRLATCSENPEPDRVDELIGMDNRQLKAFVEQLNKSASRIEKIGASSVGKIFDVASISDPWTLPILLNDFGLLCGFVGQLRWRTYWVTAKKRLINYVRQRTGHYLDREVAELIAIITNDQGYTEHVHNEWRRRNSAQRPANPDPSGSNHLIRKIESIVRSVFYMCAYALIVRLKDRN